MLFLSGPLQHPGAFLPLAHALAAQGYSTYLADLLRPQYKLCTHPSTDGIVDTLHESIQRARICSPPIAVGAYAEANILQKYLESYALSGAILLSPLPPAPQAALHALLRAAGSAQRLPRTPTCAGAEDATQALAAALAPRARSATAARVAAAHLQRLAREPVNLEPQPVPMLLLGDAQDEGVAATAALHGLAAAPHTDAAALAWVTARF